MKIEEPIVITNNSISSFDVDNTLVMWEGDYFTPRPGTIEFEYGDTKVYLRPHKFHALFLKHCCTRGDWVEIWSQNGYAWALQVARKLGLYQYASCIRGKSTRHIDDKQTIPDIVGNHIYIKEDK